MAPRDRFELTLLLLVYVLPVTVGAVLLAAVGLPQLALILLAVETVVGTAVFLAQRPPRERSTADAAPAQVVPDEPPLTG